MDGRGEIDQSVSKSNYGKNSWGREEALVGMKLELKRGGRGETERERFRSISTNLIS